MDIQTRLSATFGQPLIPPERYGFYDKLMFVVYVLLLPPLLATRPGLFGDGDVSWHVAAGQWILEHGRIPDTDPFSFTMAGQPWVAHEWLAEILYAGAFDLAGYAGLAAVVTLAITILHATVFIYLRARVSPVAMLVAFIAMDLILAKFFMARPHLLVWPLFAIWTALLLKSRDEREPPPPALAVMMVVWTNLHGSFALGFIIAGAIGLDAVIASGWSKRMLRGWVLFGLAALFASFLNLNGLPGLLHPFSIMGMDTLRLIDEWNPSSPFFSPLFYVVLLGVLAVIILKGVKLRLGEAALMLLLLGLAFAQIRHQSWLAIVAAMMLTPQLAGPSRREAPPLFRSSRERRRWIGGATAVALVACAVRFAVPLQPKESGTTPLRLIASIPTELRTQPVLNEYGFGGPLILAGIRPYIDGRADMYGDEFLQDYVDISHGDMEKFAAAVEKYDIRWTAFPPKQPLVKFLDKSPQWRRIYSDKVGVIHVRR